MTAAKNSFGSSLSMAEAGSSLVAVTELLTITPPNTSRATIDATHHASPGGAMEVISSGVYDPGEVSGQVHYIAGSANDDAFLAAVTSGDLYDFAIRVKAATGTEDMEFSGYVTAYSINELPVDGKQAANFTIKVTGPITQAPTS